MCLFLPPGSSGRGSSRRCDNLSGVGSGVSAPFSPLRAPFSCFFTFLTLRRGISGGVRYFRGYFRDALIACGRFYVLPNVVFWCAGTCGFSDVIDFRRLRCAGGIKAPCVLPLFPFLSAIWAIGLGADLVGYSAPLESGREVGRLFSPPFRSWEIFLSPLWLRHLL